MSSSPPEAESLPCPRCHSRDTKFCYFNNYSTAQPRHFCKNCKRYWTAGGSLRNVPVGGGLRKSKKSKLSKHGKALLSASPEDFLNPGKSVTSGSPSSSTDGVVDEAFATSAAPLLAYCPTFDFASEGLLPEDCTPLPASHSLHHMNLTQSCEGHGSALLPNGHYQLAHDALDGFHHSQNWYGNMDQTLCNYGEISSEPSQASRRPTVVSSMNTRYPTLQRYPEIEGREIEAETGVRQNIDEPKSTCKQGNAQCPIELSHDGIPKNLFPTEDEDEGLGNVINVRYPYDWEQVSEVLFGGTPDFFQMPTF